MEVERRGRRGLEELLRRKPGLLIGGEIAGFCGW